jgi:purine-binding chemotaxis protein CheW
VTGAVRIGGDPLAALKAEFDLGFAQRPAGEREATDAFLAIRVNGNPYAIRLRDLSGLATGRPVAPLPAGAPGLLGVAGIRGGLVPVYSLGPFLGHGEGGEAPRWIALWRGADRLALAFHAMEGAWSLPASAVRAADPEEGEHVREVTLAREGEIARPVIQVASIVETIKRRAAAAASVGGG